MLIKKWMIILKFTTDIEVKKKLAKDIEENGEVI